MIILFNNAKDPWSDSHTTNMTPPSWGTLLSKNPYIELRITQKFFGGHCAKHSSTCGYTANCRRFLTQYTKGACPPTGDTPQGCLGHIFLLFFGLACGHGFIAQMSKRSALFIYPLTIYTVDVSIQRPPLLNAFTKIGLNARWSSQFWWNPFRLSWWSSQCWSNTFRSCGLWMGAL